MRYLFTFIFCFIMLRGGAATYYIDPTNGVDTAAGSEVAPWRTMDKFFTNCLAGDIGIFLDGTYTNDEVLTKVNGNAANYITMLSSNAQGAVIAGRINITNSYYKFQNFDIQRRLQFRFTNANHWVIESNHFHDGGEYFNLDNTDSEQHLGPHDNIVRSNLFWNGTENASCVVSGYSNIFYGNTFSNNAGWDCFRVTGAYNVISNNTFVDLISATNGNHTDIIQTFGSSDTNTPNSCSHDIIFCNNMITNNEGQWGNLESTSSTNIHGWTFANNVLVRARMQMNVYVPEVKFLNNTIINDDNYVAPIGYRRKDPTNINWGRDGMVFNNIFYNNGTGTNDGFYSLGTNCLADYNFVAGTNGITRNAAFFTDANGINGGDPGFVSATDLRLDSGSILIGAGTNLDGYFTTDFTGATRTNWDIGAYEFDASESPAADETAPSVAVTSPSSTNAWHVTLTGTASDNVGVDHVTVSVNGGTAVTATGTTNWSALVDLREGPNTVQVTAYDAANNSGSTNVTIDFVPGQRGRIKGLRLGNGRLISN